MVNESLFNYVSKDQCKFRTRSNGSLEPCTRWDYARDVLSDSFIIEFDLVCDRAYLRELLITLYFVGALFSYGLVMFVDMIGRQYILLATVHLSIILTIWQLFIHSLWQQAMLLVITGFVKSIYISIAFTTLIELMPINSLDLAASNFWVLYGVNYMLCAVFAFWGRSWRMISVLSMSLTIFYPLYFCFVPETPRWLMLNQKRTKTFKTMCFIAKVNNRSINKSDIDDWTPIHEKTGRFWNLFKYKLMIYRLLILNFAAWAFAFAYIGSSTDLKFASNNIFITTFVMGFIELPCGPLAGILTNRLGRKKSMSGLCGLGVFGLLSMAFLESDLSKSSWQPWLKIVLAMVAKLGFTSAWVIFDIIINELIPTSDRNAGLSLVYIAVSLGSIVSSYIHTSAQNLHYAAPNLLYSIMLIGTIILVMLFLPETHHLPVPQTVQQAVSLVINKEQEWKSQMILEAQQSGMHHKNDTKDLSI